MDQTFQYKGIFYKHKASHKFYEGGAHFNYYSLVKILNKIKEDLNKDRDKEKDLSLSKESEKKEKEQKEKEENGIKEKIEVKKINIPILSMQKNKSMSYLLNDNNKKIKNDLIKIKKDDDLFQKENFKNNNKIKIEQNPKNSEYSNSIRKINKINKLFNNSIYSNRDNLNIPLLYNQKNRSEGKTINYGDNSKLIKKKSYLEPIKSKYNYNLKMSSTIGFNENNKYFNYLMNNYNNIQNKNSRNKNINNHNSVSQTIKKYNNNNINTIDKFNLMNNFNKNKVFENFSKNTKLYNANSIDYNINDNYTKLNKNKINNTKINFNKKRGINEKIIINGDRKKERMNMSIINFSMLKKNNKFYAIKNK